MTALCASNGPSQAKPGIAQTVIYGSGAIASFLNNKGMFWAVVVAPYLGVLSYDLLAYCATDPPALPTITATDVANVLTFGDPVAHAASIAKFEQFIGHYVWTDLCECVSPPQPTPPAATGQPSGYTATPPATTAPNAGPCQVENSIWNPVSFPAGDFTNNLSTGNVRQFLGQQVGLLDNTYFVCTVSNDGSGTDPHDMNIEFAFAFPNGTSTGGGTIKPAGGIVPPGKTISFTIAPTISGAVTFNYQIIFPDLATHTGVCSVTVSWFCVPGQGLNPAACSCATDPVLLGLLNQLTQLTTLVQRESVPFAYIAGTAHAALSGSGVISVQGLLGCKISITTTPSNIGVESGDPLEYFGFGWIAWGTADGFTDRQRIHHNPQLSFPAVAGQYTQIGYSLASGVVATITEIDREA